ncbi:MAG: hypothetical protein ACK5LM_02725 [Lactovum sp.]
MLNTEELKADSSTQQQMLEYQKKLDTLSEQMTENTIDSIKLEKDIATRKSLVEDQMRNMQENQQYASPNVLYQIFFNQMSLQQAVAMSTVINQSMTNIEQLKVDEEKLEKEKKEIQAQQKEVEETLNILNTKYQNEMAVAEAEKQAKLAMQAEEEKESLEEANESNSLNVTPPTDNSNSNNSNNNETTTVTPPPVSIGNSSSWSDWPPAAAAQYVSNGTGVSATVWLKILYRESGGNPTIVNPSSGTYGYFQMNGAAHGGVNYAAMSPVEYLNAVINLYHTQGAGAWSQTWW